ncbi:MAG: selenocysteine-specific translation elongation factor [Kiritimatiellae bacterium]|nr:selenocysteine-specific translation elongation factor [Kiritimatiellia bacterium]
MKSNVAPGQVRAAMPMDVVAMFCTAGHVDHGKTLLVRMLTGCATDRLKEEIERGLTIELGFAPCGLGDGLCAGVVDVPGHERFVRTMVAGVSGIEFCVLVIAADDGIMPQTREHVDIMELMGLTRGIVALTKIDLVDEETRARRIEEIRAYLDTTFLRGAPICPISSITGEGLDGFYEMLSSRLRAGVCDRAPGIFRMPIERAILRPGFGAVVTGIPVAGRVAEGEMVECVPGGTVGRVRKLQRFGRDATSGGAGQCLALNVPEFAKTAPERGQVLSSPGMLRASHLFHARVRSAPRLDPPLRHAEAVAFHSGTAEAQGRIYLLDPRELKAGAEGWATIRVDAPVAAAAGDRFIIRRLSPPMTVGGGRIFRADEEDRRLRRNEALEDLRARAAALGDAEWDSAEGRIRRAEDLLARGPQSALRTADLARELLLVPDALRDLLAPMIASGRIVELSDGWVAHEQRVSKLTRRMEQRLTELARASGRLRVPLQEWRATLDASGPIWDRCCADLERAGRVRIAGGFALLAAAQNDLPETDRLLAGRMLDLLEAEGYETTHPAELSTALHASPADCARILEYLCTRGDVTRVAPNVVLTTVRLRAAQQYVVDTIRASGALDSSAFRAHLGVSRKYAMAILDFLDLRKITLRVQNSRRLLPGWEHRLC